MKKKNSTFYPRLSETYKKFLINFEEQRQAAGHDFNRLFSDFLELTVRGLHPKTLVSLRGLCKPDPDNESKYLEVIKAGKYNTKTAQYFSDNFGLLMEAVHKEPYSDILGEFFSFEITRGENGQFFTPDSVCMAMAKINEPNPKPDQDDFLKKMVYYMKSTKRQNFYDPTAGSGRMFLKSAKLTTYHEIPQNHFYYAQDIDYRCAKMSAINMCLNGLRGEVAQGNSLGGSKYINQTWSIHKNDIFGILPISVPSSDMFQIMRNQEKERKKEQKNKQPSPSTEKLKTRTQRRKQQRQQKKQAKKTSDSQLAFFDLRNP